MTSVTAYLCTADAARAIDFYVTAFGAVETTRWTDQQGRIGHAEFTIGDTKLMIADEHPEIGVRGPLSIGGTPVSFALEVDDADTTFDAAVAAGATVDRPLRDEPHGSRSGWVVDPFGHRWGISSKLAEVSDAELREKVGEEYTIT